MHFVGAFGAKTFYHKVGRVGNVAIGQFYLRYMLVAQTDGLPAFLAEKVQMGVFILIVMVAFANFVSHAAVAALNNVHQMILAEKI